ncbi:hypothetical protein FACS1894200_03090 [Spirochaetia bacterium]|nr:hypothetical protein FACS1894200_03090 [Spirochaetia bacterium]
MENKRKGETSPDSIPPAIQAAAEAATTSKKPGRKPGEKKEYGFVTQRIEKERYEELQELFGGKGLAMATAANMSLMYIAEMIESGAMTISRGGIIDLHHR